MAPGHPNLLATDQFYNYYYPIYSKEAQCTFHPSYVLNELFILSMIFDCAWEFIMCTCVLWTWRGFRCVPWGILWELLREYGVSSLLL